MADRVPNSSVNIPASGTFQPPPANAPHEVTVPGSERPTAEQVARARSNERELSTYAPTPMTVEQMAGYLGKTVEEIQAMQQSGGVALAPPIARIAAPTPLPPPAPLPTATAEPSTLIPGVLVDPSGRPITSSVKPVDSLLPSQDPQGLRAAARAVHPAAATRPDPTEPYYPAGSDTDSPSRGLPTAVADPGKQITGGFGDLGEAQYFPLDGIELRQVIEKLLVSLHDRIQDDLRFSIAATYPRVRARVLIDVECFAADHSFQIEKKLIPPHEKTPLDVAKQFADEVVFCIVEQHLEMTDTGESVTPPNAVRLELSLPLPRKHAVELPGKQRVLVDVGPTIAG